MWLVNGPDQIARRAERQKSKVLTCPEWMERQTRNMHVDLSVGATIRCWKFHPRWNDQFADTVFATSDDVLFRVPSHMLIRASPFFCQLYTAHGMICRKKGLQVGVPSTLLEVFFEAMVHVEQTNHPHRSHVGGPTTSPSTLVMTFNPTSEQPPQWIIGAMIIADDLDCPATFTHLARTIQRISTFDPWSVLEGASHIPLAFDLGLYVAVYALENMPADSYRSSMPVDDLLHSDKHNLSITYLAALAEAIIKVDKSPEDPEMTPRGIPEQHTVFTFQRKRMRNGELEEITLVFPVQDTFTTTTPRSRRWKRIASEFSPHDETGQ